MADHGETCKQANHRKHFIMYGTHGRLVGALRAARVNADALLKYLNKCPGNIVSKHTSGAVVAKTRMVLGELITLVDSEDFNQLVSEFEAYERDIVTKKQQQKE